jgi:hypothetical protein
VPGSRAVCGADVLGDTLGCMRRGSESARVLLKSSG